MIFIANDEQCNKERLYIGLQIVDTIYSFIKKSQIRNNKFYICIKPREASNLQSYEINIKNEDYAYLPLDKQASYYISDTNVANMNFLFPSSNDFKQDSQVTFWVKGKKFTEVTIDNNSLLKYPYNNGYVYYGLLPTGETHLTIRSEIGNYVTIGSTVISDGKTHEMKINANEMVIATRNNICIPIIYADDFSHIEGTLYTKKAKFFFARSNGTALVFAGTVLESIVTDGVIDDYNAISILGIDDRNGLYCLSKTERDLNVFDLQMVSNANLSLVHAPLVPGEIKRHFLFLGEFAIFYGMKPYDDAKEVNLNLKINKGFPELYFDNCKEFPTCKYNQTNILNLTNPAPSNMITVYSFYLNESAEYKQFNPISSFQPLMIVYCGMGGNTEFLGESSFCEFETSYFTNMDTINLYEERTFSQYLLGGEDDKYRINLEGENARILYLDMLLFSGDADLVVNNFRGEANKYYLSNKVFYSIHLDSSDTFEFSVKASSNCFYMVQYQFAGENEKNTIESGVNYITSKFLNENSSNKLKYIDLINFKVEHEQPYLFSFYSPNCQFELKWICNISNSKEETISQYGNAAQKIINSSNPYYAQEKYSLYYRILDEQDESQTEKKYCMVYSSGLEISSSADNFNGRSISLSEAVPHVYTYSNQYPFIFYSYYVSDQEKTLVLNFRLTTTAYFDINIKVNRQYLRNHTIFRSGQLYIKKEDFESKCEELEVCPVLVTVKMRNSTRIRRVELTMYQMDSTPLYIEKNVIKRDVVHGDRVKHYYFQISNEEYGDITLDFKRGSGNIYASIEERTKTEPMNQPDWRGIYHFPMTNDESLKYRTYGKKILIEDKDTKKCQNGCYVLITIVSNSKYFGDYDDETATYRISINPRIMKTDPTVPSPKVKMSVNDFVIGDIVYGLPENRKYDYYTLTLPYTSDYVEIDWQADAPLLLINVGDERPTKNKAHFEFPPIGSDFLYVLNKTKILEKGGYDTNISLRGITLTLGIYSETNDSLQSSPYAFKIFLPPRAHTEVQLPVEIIHIRSDQKVQCLPFEFVDNHYVCLFAVIIDDIDATRNLIIYPRNQDGSTLEIYGNLTNAELVERNEMGYIINLMMLMYGNDTYKIAERYVYLENMSRENSYFFMLHATDNSESVMEVMTSTQVYYDDVQIYPNPSTVQIFATGNKNVSLNFITTQDLLLNIVSIAGTGGFHWGDEKGAQDIYYLQGII